MARAAARRWQLILGFTVVVTLIGLNIVAVRISARDLPPLWAAAGRFAIVAVILWGVMLARREAAPRGGALAAAALYGVLEVALFFGLGYWGLAQVPAALAAVLLAATPLATLLFAASFRLERLTGRALLGALLAIVGIYLLEGTRLAEGVPWPRLAALVGAVLGAAGAAVAVRGLPRSSPLATNSVGMAVGAAALAGWSLAAGESWVMPSTARVWAASAFLVVSSLALFPLFVWLIHEWSASGAAYATVLAPLVSVPAAAWLLHEPIGIVFVAAAVLLLSGVYIGALRRRAPSLRQLP